MLALRFNLRPKPYNISQRNKAKRRVVSWKRGRVSQSVTAAP